MKTPTFHRTKVSGLLHSSEKLNDILFSEYRGTKEFKNVLTVKVRHFGPETKWTKKHDFISEHNFILDSGNAPSLTQVDLALKFWQDTYPGVYHYTRIEEHIFIFSI